MDRSSQKNLADYNIITIVTKLYSIIAEVNNSYVKTSEDDERLKIIKNNTNSITV